LAIEEFGYEKTACPCGTEDFAEAHRSVTGGAEWAGIGIEYRPVFRTDPAGDFLMLARIVRLLQFHDGEKIGLPCCLAKEETVGGERCTSERRATLVSHLLSLQWPNWKKAMLDWTPELEVLEVGRIGGVAGEGEEHALVRLKPLGDAASHGKDELVGAVADREASEPAITPAFDDRCDDANLARDHERASMLSRVDSSLREYAARLRHCHAGAYARAVTRLARALVS
jgi:hypothetical protein